MTNAIKCTFVTAAAVASVATVLVLSGGPTQAQAPLQEGINNVTGVVVDCGRVVGRDPDINVRLQLLKDGCDPTGGDGGGGE